MENHIFKNVEQLCVLATAERYSDNKVSVVENISEDFTFKEETSKPAIYEMAY